MATSVEFIDNFDTFRRIAPAWAGLHQAAGGGPFCSVEWALAWAAAYAPTGPTPHIAVVWRDDQLVAGALLGIVHGSISALAPAMKVRKLVMLCSERAGYHEVLVLPGHSDAVVMILDALVDQGNWQIIDLTPIKPGPALEALAQRAGALGLMVMQRAEIQTAICDLAGGWDGYLLRRSANGRTAIRSTSREVEANHHKLTQTGTPGPVADAVLEKVMDLSQLCWKAQMGTDIGTDPKARLFFRTLWQGLSARGAMRLNLVEIDGESAASATTLIENGQEYGLVLDFNESFAALSPGRYIVSCALSDAASRGITQMDLLRQTSFSSRFADRSEEFMRLRLCRRFGVVGIWMAVENRLRPLGRELRRRHKLRTRKRGAFK